jgi:endoglucanase
MMTGRNSYRSSDVIHLARRVACTTRLARRLAAILLVLSGCVTHESTPDAALAEYPESTAGAAPLPASPSTRAAFAQLGPGINFGNMLEAPSEGAWGSRVRDEYAAMVWQAGFRHVRLPVRWSAHATRDAQARIDPAFMQRVDAVVTRLLDQGFTVVLNMHHYRQLDGDRLDNGEFAVDRDVVRVRFLAIWRQIATHFAGRSPRLWFELYNEPHGDQSAAAWNSLASRALRTVRETNPERIVVVGPVRWNSADALDQLALPADAQLVATVHDYQPFDFTHQQAEWAGPEVARKRGVLCCDTEQRRKLVRPLDIAQQWAARHDMPMWLGEFGSYGGPPAVPNDMGSRAEYTRLVREAAEQRGIAWAYWELDSGFGVYDPQARTWRAPLRSALLPSS